LDRFCDAMIAIRGEIEAVINSDSDKLDNPLKNAPHTATEICSDGWTHAYSRELAAFPTPATRVSKFWPAVARIDNTHGDKNLVCSCPDISSYGERAAPAAV
jgi:glycine dehydrogenase